LQHTCRRKARGMSCTSGCSTLSLSPAASYGTFAASCRRSGARTCRGVKRERVRVCMYACVCE
jgi:hypothetical protein